MPARCGLVAEEFEQAGIRSDEGDPRLFAGTRKRGIFGEKAVSGMDRVDFFLFRQSDDSGVVQIRLDRTFAFADEVGLIGFESVQREPVFVRVDRNRAEAEFIRGAEYTDSDFASVQCEEFFPGVIFRLP